MSPFKELILGVPKCSVLAPFFFLIYLNDLRNISDFILPRYLRTIRPFILKIHFMTFYLDLVAGAWSNLFLGVRLTDCQSMYKTKISQMEEHP